MMKYYAVYLRKNDKLVASGTGKECQKQMGLASLNSFRSLVSKVKSGRNKKYEVLVEDLLEE